MWVCDRDIGGIIQVIFIICASSKDSRVYKTSCFHRGSLYLGNTKLIFCPCLSLENTQWPNLQVHLQLLRRKIKTVRLNNTKRSITYTCRMIKQKPNNSLPEPIITRFMEAPMKCFRNNLMAPSQRARGSWPEKDWLLPHVNRLKGWSFGEVWENSYSMRLESLLFWYSNSIKIKIKMDNFKLLTIYILNEYTIKRVLSWGLLSLFKKV